MDGVVAAAGAIEEAKTAKKVVIMATVEAIEVATEPTTIMIKMASSSEVVTTNAVAITRAEAVTVTIAIRVAIKTKGAALIGAATVAHPEITGAARTMKHLATSKNQMAFKDVVGTNSSAVVEAAISNTITSLSTKITDSSATVTTRPSKLSRTTDSQCRRWKTLTRLASNRPLTALSSSSIANRVAIKISSS